MSGLLEAVGEGDLARVQRLIREGADVNERDEQGWSALLLAARLNVGTSHLAMLQWLLEKGGSSMAETTNDGLTMWNWLYIYRVTDAIALSPLLKVMVMLEDAAKRHTRRDCHPGPAAPSASAIVPGAAAGRSHHALPFAHRAAAPRCRLCRDHSGGHVDGRSARQSSSSQKGTGLKSARAERGGGGRR
jgi:hypothetical protein